VDDGEDGQTRQPRTLSTWQSWKKVENLIPVFLDKIWREKKYFKFRTTTNSKKMPKMEL